MFYAGQTVEFTSRKGETLTGAVVKAPTRRQSANSKITVTVENGDTYNVPARLLKQSTKKVDNDALGAKGRDLVQRRAELTEAGRPHREERAKKQADRFKGTLDRYSVGDPVEVFSRGSWGKAVITKKNYETGKFTTTNPSAQLVARFGGMPGRKFNDTITVLANRVRAIR